MPRIPVATLAKRIEAAILDESITTNEVERQRNANNDVIRAYQWIILCGLGLLTTRHLIYTIKRRHRAWRLALHKIRALNDEVRGFQRLEPPPRTRNVVEHLEALLLTPLVSRWWCGLANPLQVGVVGMLLIANTVLLLVVSMDWRQIDASVWNHLHVIALRSGWLSLAQLPAIIALTGRNSPIQFATGIQYQHLRFAHRVFAFWMVLFGVLHTIEASIASVTWFGGAGVRSLYLDDYLGRTGLIILGGAILALFCSLSMIRKRFYEFFLVSHIIGAGMILGGLFYHISSNKVFLYVSIGLWGFERLARIAQSLSLHLLARLRVRPPLAKAIATLIEGAIVLRVEYQGTWKAGQHAYISIWDRAFISNPLVYGQSHPFSIANVPRSGALDQWEEDQAATFRGLAQAPKVHEMLFVIRTRNGLTKVIADELSKSPTASKELLVAVEGPYGRTIDTEQFQEILFLAGGTGISHVMSMLEDVIHKARVSYSRARSIRLIWTVQSIEQSIWTLSALLESAKEAFEAGVELRLELYVTRTPSGTRVEPETNSINTILDEKPLPHPPPLTAILNQHTANPNFSVMSPQFEELMETAPMADALTVSGGRPYWPGVLPSFVGAAEGKSLVVACGPGTMSQEIRWEVSKLAKTYPVSLDVALFEC